MQAKSIISAFLGMGVGDDYSPPEANAHENQSGGIIEMLKKLKDEFRTKLAECQKEEMNSAHAYDMVVQDLVDSIENSNASIGEKTVTRARKQEKAAQDKKDLAATITMKAEDEKTLSDMEVECEEKKLSFGEKQQLRTEEIEAVGQAIKILQSGDVSGNAEKHLALAQTSESTALTQLRGQESASGVRGHVRDFLASEGRRLHSNQLALLSQKIAADPFGKVKKMIDSMITRLLNEANEDASHEGFCDKEMGQSKITRGKLTEDIDALEAAVDEGQAQILLLTQGNSRLTAEVADLDATMMESTKLRNKEKAQNKAVVEDAKQAIGAVQAATAVLKDFYKAASTATALVQGKPKHQEGMQTFGDQFTGAQEEAGGVMALLEVIESDFSNVKADTLATEAAAARSYEAFTTEAKRNKATKQKAIEMDEADKISAEGKLQSDTNDLKSTQDQLLAANRYHATLVPQCVDKGQTFGERKSSRAEEITSLKEALEILGQ